MVKRLLGLTFIGASALLNTSCVGSKFGQSSLVGKNVTSLGITFSGFSVSSPSNSLPRIIGTAESGVSTVNIYTDDACEGELFTSGSAAAFVGAGISLPMSAVENVDTTFYGAGVSDTGIGDCIELSHFLYDGTAPTDPSALSPVNNVSTSTTASPTFSWTASTDGGGSNVSYFYSIGTTEGDDDVVAWVTNGSTLSKQVTGLTLTDETEYFFNVKAVDALNNESNVSSVSWFVSSLKLNITFTSLNPATDSQILRPVITGTVPTGSGDDVANIKIYSNGTCTDDGAGSLITTFSGVQYEAGTAITSDLSADTSTTLSAKAFSATNVPSPVCLQLGSYRNDKTAPSEPLIIGGATVSNSTDTSPTFTWEASSDVHGSEAGSGLANYLYSIIKKSDASVVVDWTSLGSSAVSKQVSGLSLELETDYTFRLKAVDKAGNESVVSARDWNVTSGFVPADVVILYPATNEVIRSNTRNVNGTCQPTNGTVGQVTLSTDIPNSTDVSVDCDVNGNFIANVRFADIGTTLSDRQVSITATQGAKSDSRIVKYDVPFRGQNAFGGAKVHAIAYAKGATNLGKIFVGGEFTTYKGKPQKFLVRLNRDGSIDPSFKVASSIIDTGGFVYSILPMSDGGAIVGGAFTKVKKNNTDPVESTTAGIISQTVNRIVRFNDDGSRNETFRGSGSVAVNFGFGGPVRAIAEDPLTNDIFVGGEFTTYRNAAKKYFVRIDEASGNVNASVNYHGFDAKVFAILPHPTEDSVFVGGYFRYYGVATEIANKVSRLVKIKANGDIDTTFHAADGTAGFDVAATGLTVSAVKALAFNNPTAPTRLYAGGLFTSFKRGTEWSVTGLVALNPSNGQRDTLFNNGPISPATLSVLTVKVDAFEQVYIGGDFASYDGAPMTAKFAKIQVDGGVVQSSSFSLGSRAGFSTTAAHTVSAIAINENQSNVSSPENLQNDILVGGLFTSINNQPFGSIARIKFNGALDAFVDDGGPLSMADSVLVVKAVPDNSGDFYVGGCFTEWGTGANKTEIHHIARVNADGSVDPSFKPNLSGGCVYDIAFDRSNPDIIYVGGAFNKVGGATGTTVNRLAKFNSGVLDTVFLGNTGDGFCSTALCPVAATIYVDKILQNPDNGNLYIGGNFSFYKGVAKKALHALTETGNDLAGFTPTITAPTTAGVWDLKWSDDNYNKLYVAGSFTGFNGISGKNYLVRVDAGTGALDVNSFNPGVIGAQVKSVLPLANGSVYVAGDFTTYNGVTNNRLVLSLPNGLVDSHFSAGAGATGGLYGGSTIAAETLLPVDTISEPTLSLTYEFPVFTSKLLVGGFFTSASSRAGVGNIAYYEDLGNLVTNDHETPGLNYFDSGIGFTATSPGIKTLENAGDGTGRFWAGGEFTLYDGYARDSLVRVNADGSID